MKFKTTFSINFKNKIYFLSFFLISGLLLNTYSNFRNFKLLNFIAEPTATISVSSNEVCKDETATVTFTGSGGTAPYTFTYTENGDLKTKVTTGTNSITSFEFKGSTPGDYIFILTKVEDNNGESIEITDQEITIKVNEPPVASFTVTNDNSCSGETMNFDNSSTGEGLTYSWVFGDDGSSTSKSPSHVFEALGCGTKDFNVKLTVTDKNGCSTSTSQKITVLEKPDIEFSDANFGGFSNCDNASLSDPSYIINVANNSNSNCISNFFIDWGDGATMASATFPANHTYSTIGVFTMKIKATGDNGCKNEVSYQVKNVTNPAGGFESPGNTSNLCPVNSELKFGISNWELNSSDTEYIVDFGDGTAFETFTQAQIQIQNEITHKYEKGSCLEEDGQFIATLFVQNACATTKFTIDNITVLQASEAEFESTTNACINNNVIFRNTSIIGDNPGCTKAANFKWDFGDGTIINDNNTNQLTNQSHSYSLPGTYTVTLYVSSRCGESTPFTKEICIQPEITPSFSLNADEGCIPLNVSTTNSTDVSALCSAPKYEWSVTYTSDNCGSSSDWNFTNGTDKNSENPEFIFSNSGKYTLSQKIITDCDTKEITKIINVKKPPTVSIDPILDSCGAITINPIANVENCTSNTGSITYNWTFTGGNPTNSTSLNPGNIEYTNPGVYVVTLEATSECGVSNKATQTFEIFEKPIITNTDLSQEICSNQSTAEIILTSNNTSINYIWSASASSNVSGFTASGTSTKIPAQILTNNSNTVGTVKYSVIPKLGSCEGETVEFIVTVNPASIISKQPISSDVCLNGTPTELEVAYQNGTGTATYQWFSNINNDTINGEKIIGATSSTYQPTTNTVGKIYYYVEISFSSGGCSLIKSNTASVTVNEQLSINSVASNQIICEGGSANQMEVTYNGGTGNVSYQWYKNTNNSNSGGNIITGETNASFTPNVFSTTGIYYYYAVVSVDGNGCSSATSNVYQIEVVSIPTFNNQPIATQELCQNATPTDLTVSVIGGTASAKKYQWYKNLSNNTTSGILISGANSDTYSPLTSSIGTFYYYAIVSQPESGCSNTSAVSQLKINEAPIVSKQPISSDVCLNGTPTELEVAYQKGTGIATYQWFSNKTDDTINGVQIAGATNSTYQPLSNTLGTTYYYVEISFSSGGCSLITSNTARVVVNEQLIINSVTSNQIICAGGIANEMQVSFTGGAGNPSYQWYKNTNNSNTGGTKITNATNANYTPTIFSTTGTFYYYVAVSLDGNGCSSATSNVYQIEVVSDPIIDNQPIDYQELCQGSTPKDLKVEVSGGTATTKNYQWFSNTTNSNIGGTAITGETSDTFSPSTNTVGTTYYYVLVSQIESGCSVTSLVSKLKVNEAPVITKQPISSDICLNEPVALLEVAYKNGTGTATYQWFSNSSDATTGGNPIAGETNVSYQPLSNMVGTTYYYAEISFSSGGCSKISSNTASVTVNEIPKINTAEITIYSEDTFTFNPNSVPGNTIPDGTNYTWFSPTINPSGSILGASAEINPQDKISETLENTSTLPAKVTYTITPATLKCEGNSFTLIVTVNPNINSNAVILNNSCFESNNSSISTNIIGGVPFETGNPYLISWSGPNGFSSNNTTISNLEAGLYTLRIEDKEGFFISEVYTITQPDLLSITSNLEKNISCFQGNDGTIDVTISGGTLPYTYNWSTVDGSGIVLNAKNQNTLTAGTYTLEVIDKNNCTTSTNFTLTEPDGLKIETVFKQDVLCFGATTGAVEISVSGGTKIETSPGVFDYIYNWSGPNGFISTSKNISNLFAGTYIVSITDNLSCTTSATIIINQTSEIEINFTKTDVTCYGKNNGSIDVKVAGGKAPYQISWSNLASGFSLSNLSANTYIATITDGNMCVKQVSINIKQPIFFIEPVVKPITCNGENDASITLNLSGGIAPFSITWSDGSNDGLQRNNLAAGTYTVILLDSDVYQCPIEKTFIITNPPAISVTSSVIDAIDCDIVNSGSIDLEISGGTTPYSFKWSNNETSEDLKNIPPGDYAVEITDANGCSITKQFNIFRQDSIEISLEETFENDCDLKIVTKKTIAKVTGGYLPYTFTWSSGVVSGDNNSIMTTSQNGTYVFIITDGKGCEKSKSFIVDVPIIGSVDFRYNAFALTTYDLLSIEDPIQFTNLTTGDYKSVKWNFGDGSITTKEENPVHTYDSVGSFNVILTVEFNSGCIEVFERTITITQGYSLVHPTAFTPNDDGYNETIRPSFRGFTNIKMTIYDTWGTTVYTEEGINLKGWNGIIRGKAAENGNYVMLVNGITFYGKEIIKSSPVTLLK